MQSAWSVPRSTGTSEVFCPSEETADTDPLLHKGFPERFSDRNPEGFPLTYPGWHRKLNQQEDKSATDQREQWLKCKKRKCLNTTKMYYISSAPKRIRNFRSKSVDAKKGRSENNNLTIAAGPSNFINARKKTSSTRTASCSNSSLLCVKESLWQLQTGATRHGVRPRRRDTTSRQHNTRKKATLQRKPECVAQQRESPSGQHLADFATLPSAVVQAAGA